MRRLAAIALLAAALAVFTSAASGGEARYRFTAVFDSAQGMVGGQLVKIAGARVGQVEEVSLIPGDGYRARMVLEIGGEYGPLYADASCRLLPEGLISENFVDCDPGTATRQELANGPGGLPELTSTETPLSLQDVLNIFSAPTDERLRILLSELGIATAGRGADINAMLRRSNPALTQANRVLEIIAGQRGRITGAIEQTDRVLAALARDERAVAELVARGADVSSRTAAKRGRLGEAIRALPPLLDAADGGLTSLNRAMAAGTPVLGDLRAAAPGLGDFTSLVEAFSQSGLPAVNRLTSAARTGRNAVPSIGQAVANLRDLGAAAPPVAADLGELLVSVRDTGGWNGMLRNVYGLAVGAAARDQRSHYYGAVVNLFPICILVPPEVVPVPGCDHSYDSPEEGRIPINDPLNRAAQRRAFVRWLEIGGPEQAPEWLRGSIGPLIRTVADSLALDLDAVLHRLEGGTRRRVAGSPLTDAGSGAGAGPARGGGRSPAPVKPPRGGLADQLGSALQPLDDPLEDARQSIDDLLGFLIR